MSSLFPRQLDTIPFIPDRVLEVPGSNTTRASRIPAATLSRIYDAISALERHLGFSFASGGDTRPDATAVSATAPGRTLVQMSRTFRIPAASDGVFALSTDWSSLFDETQIANARPYPAPGGDVPAGNPTASLRTQNPLLITARRLDPGLAPHQILCHASIVPQTTGKPSLTLCTPDLTRPFTTNEAVQITALFYGGI